MGMKKVVKKKEKTFLDKFYDLIKESWKKSGESHQKYKKIYDNLNFVEKEEYRDLMKKIRPSNFFWVIFPFKTMFYLAIFGLVVWIAFDINLLEPFKLIVKLLFKLYIFFIFLFLIEILMSNIRETKRSKEILDYLK